MSDDGIHYRVDISDADGELRRLDDGPDLPTVARLEAALIAQFAATQEYVHIITGSLRASGVLDSDLRRGVWHGQISYGGSSSGAVHDPVRYAQIEQQRAPGGALHWLERGFLAGTDITGRHSTMHDFMAPAQAFEPRYEAAMLAFLRGTS